MTTAPMAASSEVLQDRRAFLSNTEGLEDNVQCQREYEYVHVQPQIYTKAGAQFMGDEQPEGGHAKNLILGSFRLIIEQCLQLIIGFSREKSHY